MKCSELSVSHWVHLHPHLYESDSPMQNFNENKAIFPLLVPAGTPAVSYPCQLGFSWMWASPQQQSVSASWDPSSMSFPTAVAVQCQPEVRQHSYCCQFPHVSVCLVPGSHSHGCSVSARAPAVPFQGQLQSQLCELPHSSALSILSNRSSFTPVPATGNVCLLHVSHTGKRRKS